ncbi:MAG: deoxyribodipyrimidine photo-lyase [Aestuariivita sp.]|nr:deoxyribodipyrimidine photo-lyase [Aestuariivita sp.]
MHIVWFKSYLRIEDHEALTQAAKAGYILPLHILEPELWHQPDMSYRHYIFLQKCMGELDQALSNMGQKLVTKVDNTVDVLENICKHHSVAALWSH